MQLDVLTYSSSSALCRCERYYEHRYEQCLRPLRRDGEDDESEALAIGGWMHLGIDTYSKLGLQAAVDKINQLERSTPAIGPDVPRIAERAAKIRAMIRVAAEHWPVNGSQPISEHVLEMPVINPDGGTSRSFVYMGVVDGVDGATLVDWKSTSDVDEFIQSSTIGYQTELYAAALLLKGIKIDHAVFRLITKPGIRFCGKDKGDPLIYENRCIEWLKEKPRALHEHDMYINPARVTEAQHWLWAVGKRVLENRRSGRWLKNASACRLWGRECEYMSLCMAEASGGDISDIIQQRYERVEDSHPELSKNLSPIVGA